MGLRLKLPPEGGTTNLFSEEVHVEESENADCRRRRFVSGIGGRGDLLPDLLSYCARADRRYGQYDYSRGPRVMQDVYARDQTRRHCGVQTPDRSEGAV